MTLPYESLADYPDEIRPGTILSRLVAGLGFRLRWATEGLTAADGEFRPHPDGFSIAEVLEHVGRMVTWIHAQLTMGLADAAVLPDLAEDHDFLARREHCLRCLALLEADAARLTEPELAAVQISRRGTPRPFWVLVNGPLADALTHVGQISAWRRQAGNPAPPSDPFDGIPPG